MGFDVTGAEAHVVELAKANGITIGSHSRGGRAWLRKGGGAGINIRQVKSAITYAVALHELGHILGKNRSGPRLFRETAAWVWAKAAAGAQWAPAMDGACE